MSQAGWVRLIYMPHRPKDYTDNLTIVTDGR